MRKEHEPWNRGGCGSCHLCFARLPLGAGIFRRGDEPLRRRPRPSIITSDSHTGNHTASGRAVVSKPNLHGTMLDRTWRLGPPSRTPVSALPSTTHTELQHCITTRGVSWLKSVSRPHLNCPVPYAAPTRNDVQTKVFVSVVCGLNAASLGPSAFPSFVSPLSSLYSPHAWVVVIPVVDLHPRFSTGSQPQFIRRLLLVASDRPPFSITRTLHLREAFLTFKLLSRFQLGQS
jgi:hypothetical protein